MSGEYLGIVDWGIGGLSVYRRLREVMPEVPVLYLSDTGAVPYGTMTRTVLATRLERVLDWMAARGATRIVLACNAASTALADLAPRAPAVIGVIEPSIRAVARLRPSRLAIIGGRRTVLSGVYRRAFMERHIAVRQRIAQPLSAMIESGDLTSEMVRAVCEHILRPLRGATHLLLACTHYPAVATLLAQLMPGTIVIDPAQFVVDAIPPRDLPRSSSANDVFHTTGDTAQMQRSASAAFGVRISRVRRARL